MAKRKETQQKTDTKKPKQIAKNKPAPKTQKNKGIWDCIEIYLRSIIMYFVSKLFAEELKGSIAVAQLNEWTVIVEFSSRLMQTAAVCRCTDTLARVLLRCLFLTDAFQIKPFFLSFELMYVSPIYDCGRVQHTYLRLCVCFECFLVGFNSQDFCPVLRKQ